MTARRRNKIINIPTRVEPKVFFANERTFLHWLRFGLILSVVAITLLNFGNATGRALSVAFTVVALGIMIRALVIFLWRSDRIRNRDVLDYSDYYGPFMLVTAIVAVTASNLWLQLEQQRT